MDTRNNRQYVFGPFRLDAATQQMWRGEALLPLQPRPFAVLNYLLALAGEVVDSATLLKTVWGPTHVGKAALKVCIRSIREALSDDVATPRYIETVGRVGYRFIAPVTAGAAQAPGSTHVPCSETQHSALGAQDSVLVGREAELAQLHSLFEKAVSGERQLVFVTGEAGIGKTTLVDSFLQALDVRNWIGRGQCLEQYGEGEAYLPVLEALGQLCRGPDGPQVLAVLRQMAPTWVVQLPQWVSAGEAEALQAKVLGATSARMLREMAEALETLATQRPVVLVLEDLHWSDRSTLDLLTYVAQRRERAQLCVIGTYRLAEAATSEQPLIRLKNVLQTHRQCSELPLTRLTAEAVAAYVQHRFAGRLQPGELARRIHRRSEGNALFMVALADYYEYEKQTMEEGVPTTVQHLIAHQLTQLSTVQQQVVEGASVAGVEFGCAVVAAGIDVEPEAVDEVCAELSRTGQFLQAVGVLEWPDGTLSSRYRFRHALYSQVVYERMPELRRGRLHRRMGERVEMGYGKQARERAAELALHFERGRIIEKAVTYYRDPN
ncbi:MAG: AAA family ATPase [Candidatus Binatia bacterium]